MDEIDEIGIHHHYFNRQGSGTNFNELQNLPGFVDTYKDM